MVNGNKPGILRKAWYGVQFIWALIVWIVAPLLVVGRFIANFEEKDAIVPAVKAVALEAVYPLKVGFGVVADYWLEKPSATFSNFQAASKDEGTDAPQGECQGPDSPNG